MQLSILLLIRLYWLIPARFRRPCLFRESCSRYVYRQTADAGWRAGWTALRQRYHQCRPGYGYLTTPDGQTWVVLADGSAVEVEHTRLSTTAPMTPHDYSNI